MLPTREPGPGGPGRRWRRWIGAGVAALALSAAVVVALPTILLRLDPPAVRAEGTWRFSHLLEPVDGWSIRQRILTESLEMTILEGPETADGPGQCTVVLSQEPAVDPGNRTADRAPDRTPGRTVRVGAWRAAYEHTSGPDPSLTWEYAPGRTAEVTCVRATGWERALPALARAVRFEASAVRLPFTLDGLPTGYRIHSVEETWAGGSGADSVGGDETDIDSVALGLQPLDGGSTPSVWIRWGDTATAQRLVGAVGLSTRWSSEEAPNTQSIITRSLDAVADRLRVVPDPSDRSGWFDATELPR